MQPPESFPPPAVPYGLASPQDSRSSGARTADLVVTIILLIAGVFGFAILAFVSLFLAMMSDGCMGGTCDTGLMSIGWLIALIAPPIVFIATVVWTIVRLVRRRIAWWLPLAGGILAVLIWLGGVALMDAGLTR